MCIIFGINASYRCLRADQDRDVSQFWQYIYVGGKIDASNWHKNLHPHGVKSSVFMRKMLVHSQVSLYVCSPMIWSPMSNIAAQAPLATSVKGVALWSYARTHFLNTTSLPLTCPPSSFHNKSLQESSPLPSWFDNDYPQKKWRPKTLVTSLHPSSFLTLVTSLIIYTPPISSPILLSLTFIPYKTRDLQTPPIHPPPIPSHNCAICTPSPPLPTSTFFHE